MELSKPIDVDLVPPKKSIAAFGFPKSVSRTAAGHRMAPLAGGSWMQGLGTRRK